jgi:hypothetical protein
MHKITAKVQISCRRQAATHHACCDIFWQANVAAELVVCHVLLGATGAAERLLHRERDEGFAAWLPSDHKVHCWGGCCLVKLPQVG